MLRLHPTLSRLVGLTFSLLFVATVASPVAAANTAGTFTDIDNEQVAAAADALAEHAIVTGCDTDAFCPERPLRRDQFATILVNARLWLAEHRLDDEELNGEVVVAHHTVSPIMDVDVTAVPFHDVSDNVHLINIAVLARDGVTNGCADGRYCPNELVMRGQLATLLVELFDLPETDESFFDDLGGHTHRDGANRLAAAGMVESCEASLVAFCASEPVSRAEVALYVARAMDLAEGVELDPLEDRRAEQEAIDAARQEREEAARQERAKREAIWDALAECEANGQWDYGPHSNWGSGLYHGGLQFHPNTWASYRDSSMPRYAYQATREQQIVVGERVQAAQGWGAWPACSLALGLR